ncbi:MAG: glutamate--tRNA ligase [Patescibacteria group bacterium]|nr:glutamate--tRNA ligase [Patescibacteria group bacterium]
MNSNQNIRTRFAPSPTGPMHIGNLRTALYAYLVAKKNKGTFIIRIEDTDRARFAEDALEKILNALRWAGIRNDEGVILDNQNKIIEKGDYGPYFQSKRLDIYKKYSDKLRKQGTAYPCFCSKERLDDLRKKQQQEKKPPKYDKHCLELSKEEVKKRIEAGEKYVLRLNVPDNKIIEFNDEVYGKISVKGSTIDDQVLIKSDGFPTYHLAVVIDDHLMNITHVVRGEDWLPSTPKHILLYKYFNWKHPIFIHVPNILGENRKKLSKRRGDISVEDFKKEGYLSETIVNFIALLGWNPKNEQEYFTLSELSKIFNVEGLHKAGAVFDYKKLDWMNSYYIRQKNDKELFELVRPRLEAYCQKNAYSHETPLLEKITKVERERMKKIKDVTENIGFYFALKEYDPELLKWKSNSSKQTENSLQMARKTIEEIKKEKFDLDIIQETLMKTAGDKRGDLLWPLRVALTGVEKSSSPFEVAWVIGKEEALKRIASAIEKMKLGTFTRAAPPISSAE